MPPKEKRAATEKASPATRAAPPTLRTTRTTFKRTTRSQAANMSPGGSAASTKSAAPYKWPEVAPKKKKTTAKASPKKKTAAKAAPKKKAAAKATPKKKVTVKKTAAKAKAEEVEEEMSEHGGEQEDADNKVDAAAPEKSGGDKADTKTIVIEHCKQCSQFKTRANLVKEGLEGVPGIEVIINPVKPRRGCFEIREEGGETFISLLGMNRPFQPMRDLVMQEVIDNIIEKISK